MERRLYEASLSGNTQALKDLTQDDPLILDRVVTGFKETLLHISALRGHLDFTKELLSLKPTLAIELDSLGRSPLHLASAEGHQNIVRELLLTSTDVCLLRDHEGRIPLHLAVILKGRVEVIEELIHACPESTREKLDRGETVLHLCVKYHKFDALKKLMESVSVDDDLIRSVDDDGNTILHVAATLKQLETIIYLFSRRVVKENANTLNAKGFTALDLVEPSQGIDIRQLLIDFGVHRGKKRAATPPRHTWLEETRGHIMVTATVIAAMAFQAGISPPGGVWQGSDTKEPIKAVSGPVEAGTSVIGDTYPDLHTTFLAFNTVSIVSSLSIILFMLSGMPLTNTFSIWVLALAMSIAVSFMAFAYIYSVQMTLPDTNWEKAIIIIRNSLFASCAVFFIVFVIHTVHLFKMIVRGYQKLVCKLRWMVNWVRRFDPKIWLPPGTTSTNDRNRP